eukprot:6122397-Ditylum_brightwellii.AAC.1
MKPLIPEDWYRRGHGVDASFLNLDGMCVPTFVKAELLLCAPSPAVTAAALEEMIKLCHKQVDMGHIFLYP